MWRVLKSILILVVGYLAIGTVVGVVDSGLALVFPQSLPDPETGQMPDSSWLLWHVLEVGLVTGASAYCTALAVGYHELLHVGLLSAWIALVGLCTAIDFSGRWPTWFSVGMMVIPITAALLGGYLRMKRKHLYAQPDPVTAARQVTGRAVLWGLGLSILLAAHDFQNDPMYRRHFSLRSVFWGVELPFLAILGAGLGYLVGMWRRTRLQRFVSASGPNEGA